MNIQLDQELIRRCNNQSMYERGTHIQNDADREYQRFVESYGIKELNAKQLEIVNKRKVQFNALITDNYNELLRVNANFVPVNVAGPAKYPAEKMNKVQDKIDKTLYSIEDKIKSFYKNTDDILKNAYTKEEIIIKYRNGYNEPISSDDPLAKEKLQAKLEYLEQKHRLYLDFNKKARKNEVEQLPPYVLANSHQNIKSVKDRLKKIEKLNSLNEVGYYFDNGEIIFDKKDNRVKIYFDCKPNEKTRKELKSHAFKWSPTNICWQRKLTQDAIYTTKRMFKDIGSLEIIKVYDYAQDKNLTM